MDMPGNGHAFPPGRALEQSFELTWLGVGLGLRMLVGLSSVRHRLQIPVVIPYA